MPLMLRLDPQRPSMDVVRQAADLIRAGRVVAYPTDTLYGLAVDPRDSAAVTRLFALKGRPETSALTLIAASPAQVRDVGELAGAAEVLAKAWWPGPLTIVMRARPVLARETLAGGETVGVRIPRDAVASALAAAAGFCITATSANRSGMPATADPAEVAALLPDVDAIVDAGPSPGGAPSTIVDASAAPRLIREGAVPWERVLRSLRS